jgi:hypothetical protein
MASVLYKVVYKPTPPLPAELPPPLRAVVERCLAKEPDQRYQDFSAVLADLEPIRRELAQLQLSGAAAALAAQTVRSQLDEVETLLESSGAQSGAVPAPRAEFGVRTTDGRGQAPPLQDAVAAPPPVRPALQALRSRWVLGAAALAAAGMAFWLGQMLRRPVDYSAIVQGLPNPPSRTSRASARALQPVATQQPVALPSRPAPATPAPDQKAGDLARTVQQQITNLKKGVDAELVRRSAPAELEQIEADEKLLLERARNGDERVLGDLPQFGQRLKRIQARSVVGKVRQQLVAVRDQAAKVDAAELAPIEWGGAERLFHQAEDHQAQGDLRAAGAAYLQADSLYRQAIERARRQYELREGAQQAAAQTDRPTVQAPPAPPATQTPPPPAASSLEIPAQGGAFPIRIQLPNIVGVRRVWFRYRSLGAGLRPKQLRMRSEGAATWVAELDLAEVGEAGVEYQIVVESVNGSQVVDHKVLRRKTGSPP